MPQLFIQKKEKIGEIVGILILIFIGVALRLIPHPPNFAPIAAISLFSGVYLDKRYFWMIPLVAMWISDYFIGAYEVKLMIAVYLSFGIIGLIGLWLRNHKGTGMILSSALAGSLLFYLLTNFAVWAFSPGYSKDLSGLLFSYTLALPFLKNTLLGDIFYTSFLFGVWEFALHRKIFYAIVKHKICLPLKNTFPGIRFL